MIDLIDEEDTDVLFKVLVRFVPEDTPLPDEIEALSDTSVNRSKLLTSDEIDWD